MESRRMTWQTHEDYFASVPAEACIRLRRIQAEVERRVPGAQRCIGYNMPAFRARRIFLYFAAFKKHIGVYPPLQSNDALVRETAPFRGPKGNLSFPLGADLPLDLIGRVAVALAAQYDAT